MIPAKEGFKIEIFPSGLKFSKEAGGARLVSESRKKKIEMLRELLTNAAILKGMQREMEPQIQSLMNALYDLPEKDFTFSVNEIISIAQQIQTAKKQMKQQPAPAQHSRFTGLLNKLKLNGTLR